MSRDQAELVCHKDASYMFNCCLCLEAGLQLPGDTEVLGKSARFAQLPLTPPATAPLSRSLPLPVLMKYVAYTVSMYLEGRRASCDRLDSENQSFWLFRRDGKSTLVGRRRVRLSTWSRNRFFFCIVMYITCSWE